MGCRTGTASTELCAAPPTPGAVIPLPSLGSVLVGNHLKTLLAACRRRAAAISASLPRAVGITPFFEIKTGSSNVFIGGKRAARMLRHLPLLQQRSPMSKVDKVMAGMGVAVGALAIAADVRAGGGRSSGDGRQGAVSGDELGSDGGRRGSDGRPDSVGQGRGPHTGPWTDGGRSDARLWRARARVSAGLIGGFPMVNIRTRSRCCSTSWRRCERRRAAGATPKHTRRRPSVEARSSATPDAYCTLSAAFACERDQPLYPILLACREPLRTAAGLSGLYTAARLRAPADALSPADPRLVGDPVDTLTGAVFDGKIEFRLTGPLELWWWRHYDSSQVHRRLYLGCGTRARIRSPPLFRRRRNPLRVPGWRRCAFPPLTANGAVGRVWVCDPAAFSGRDYQVFRRGQAAMELSSTIPAEPALLTRLFEGTEEIVFEYDDIRCWSACR